MSLRWAEGFEVRRASSYFQRLYGATSGSLGHGSGRKHGFGATMNNDSLTTPALVGSVSNTWFVQFDLRKQTIGSFSSGTILEIQDGTGEQCNLQIINSPSFSGNFRLEFRRGTTVLETSGDFAAGATARGWHVFVLKVVVNTGTSGSYELRHYDRFGNSTVIFNTSSVNTANQGSAGADRVRLSAPGVTLDFDNWLVWDDVNSPTGTIFTNFHSGPLLVYGILPDGDGNQTDWDTSSGGTHYVLVDDPANSPNDSDEVNSQTTNDVDLYTFENVSGSLATSPTLRAVIADVRFAMKNSGTRNFQVRVRDVTTSEADQGTSIVANSLTVDQELRIMEQNPVTTAAWTASEVDGVEIGVKLES